ncbi:MAG: hypothetical protein IJ466_04500 [Clostridia bacterium]|nr:hypothetical protein [Clostridia bacterium]
MAKWTKINADELIAYKTSEASPYSSKLIIGDEMAGFPILNVNEGTLAPFSRTAGAAHEECELYYMVDVAEGSAVVLDDERIPVRNGDFIVIPGGVFHWIDNLNCDKPFKLFTMWDRQELNGIYFKRLEAWGKSMRYIKDEE